MSQKPNPIGSGGTSMETGGTGAMGGTGGTGIVGVGGTSTGGEGNDGGGGPMEDAVCGNDRLEVGELCDDGNTDDDDGCSGDCKVADPHYLCTEGKGCERIVTCGNGKIEGDEVCDDGNTDDDDGCAGDCSGMDDGFICVKPGEPCVELPVCGNGVREQGEQCDDKNADSDDGCDDACQVEPGYFCPPGEACVKLECGDGNRTPDEACEDGNTDDGDGCAADCTVEDGWLCSGSGCKPICGDGKILGPEQCDDHNNTTGDGCSSACKTEPFYDCGSAEPSVCTSSVVCGDGTVSPGEVCDPAITGQEDCYGAAQGALACKGYDNALTDPPVCNNGVIEFPETCDGAVTGCVGCVADPDYVCPTANVCIRKPKCGDGLLQEGEECDVGVISAPGCDASCQIAPNYFCSGQPSVCVASICGDGVRAPDEECDDDNTANSDGCSSTCTVETGYVCPPGGCLPFCGDGIKIAPEECDLGASPNAAACKNCNLQPGWKCGANGLGPCVATLCGNATAPTDPIRSPAYIATAKANAEPSEGCDDGNTIAGDGCGPTCQLEPTITRAENPVGSGVYPPVVTLTCGDGLKTTGEACDDGNLTNGDGCSSTCTIETGYVCTDALTRPATVRMAVTFHDFASYSTTVAGGHPHFENINSTQKNIPGAPCTTVPDNLATCGRLDSAGKPVTVGGFASIPGTAGPTPPAHTSVEWFSTWYRDTAQFTGYNLSVVQGSVPLAQVGGTSSDVYEYDSATDASLNNAFFPIDGKGLGNTGATGHNFGFTTELRYFFKYEGGETLTFRGDDDVWVFINGRLAVDVGGVHCAQAGRVVLGDADSDCSLHGVDYVTTDCAVTDNGAFPMPACAAGADPGYSTTEQTSNTDARFGITKGGVYEIALFHAERHTNQSNFRLTLSGFLSPISDCNTDCGDSIIAGSEMCDEGRSMPASGYGVCLNNCTLQFCGDKTQQGTEQCDSGANSTLYGTSGCAPGCKTPAKCGDGIVQASFGTPPEQCDKGNANQNGLYNGCSTTCQLGPYCGDGVKNGSEGCDPADHVFATYGQGKCNYNCQPAPYCGDGIRNGAEICDGTANCNANCEYDPFCGDGLQTMDEACDYGMFAFMGAVDDAPYGSCTNQCLWGPHCGDEVVQKPDGEECDDGAANDDDLYDGCTSSCLYGPHCGDGVKQGGEVCDNGFNEDEYAYPGAANVCGKGCKGVPSCGDGKLQSAFELCDDGPDNDDGAYDGCTTTCEWGPYCGDGTKNGPEQCDDGKDNKAYSADGKGCSYECTKDLPKCGDGVRNGPEQCDNGTNDGSYNGCNADCTNAPFCGDHKVQRDDGEQCDDGSTGSLTCTPTCKRRDGVR